jgi:hypothetical protein
MAGTAALLVAGGIGVAVLRSETRSTSPSGAAFCQRVAIPAYLDPNTPSAAAALARIAAGANQLGPVVLNVANGPGDSPDSAYRTVIAELQLAGFDVFGYVNTDYARRAEIDVLADTRHWSEWYDVVNVFYDQVSSTTHALGVYTVYVQDTHDRSGRAALNPGQVPNRAVAQLADITVTFEGSLELYRSFQSPAWTRQLEPDRFWHLIYATSADDLDEALSIARAHRTGYVFVTDDRLPNPWDTLPSYWDRELRAAGSDCAVRTDASS